MNVMNISDIQTLCVVGLLRSLLQITVNPPYQEPQDGDNKTFSPPVYDKFLDAAYKTAQSVEMIHPARFLFNAGNTPKEWNEKMLSNNHVKVLLYEQDASKVFANTDIKGGIAVTYFDQNKNFGAIGTFTKHNELNGILHNVINFPKFVSMSSIVISRTVYRFTDNMHKDFPEAISQLSAGHPYDMSTNIFERLPQVFFDELPIDDNEYIKILGRENNKREYKYIRKDYVNDVINLNRFKLILPSATGKGEFGEALPCPIIGEPGLGTTETFISIGYFNTLQEANNVCKYVKTKFVRSLLGILKVTQHLTPEKWRYVPMQDFETNSDISWSDTVFDIDQQLYRKYNLSHEEIVFIENNVKTME